MAALILVAVISTVIVHFVRQPAKRTVRADHYRGVKFERSRREMAVERNAVYW